MCALSLSVEPGTRDALTRVMKESDDTDVEAACDSFDRTVLNVLRTSYVEVAKVLLELMPQHAREELRAQALKLLSMFRTQCFHYSLSPDPSEDTSGPSEFVASDLKLVRGQVRLGTTVRSGDGEAEWGVQLRPCLAYLTTRRREPALMVRHIPNDCGLDEIAKVLEDMAGYERRPEIRRNLPLLPAKGDVHTPVVT